MHGTFLYLADAWPISSDALRALGAVETRIDESAGEPSTYRVRLPDGRLVLDTLTDDEAAQHLRTVAEWIASAGDDPATHDLMNQLGLCERVLAVEGRAKAGDESGIRRYLTRLATLRDGRILHGDALYDLDGACLFGEDDAPEWFSDEPPEDLDEELEARRERSLAVLEQDGHPRLDSGIPPRPAWGTWLRPLDSVVRRAVALALIAELSVDGDPVLVRARAERFGVEGEFTANERKLLDDPEGDPELAAALSWRYEAANALLWALGWVDELPPDRTSDPEQELRLASHAGPTSLAHEAALREVPVILDQLDLVQMRLHAIGEEEAPGAGWHEADVHYDRETLWEHLQALEWLVLTMDLPWDELDGWDAT